eukprot:CAMPEP_0119552768 /NCGR_PEP_ID=MMETSP1352-20130426/5687_1 /TAXON_ID=265584 /ORGANISM="Stauroneis constricta, Strain CCMP1120" /LENGTH=237 /DNA_ID=CAMNT_0007599061 /DNA_START=51 /DNA_END=761 /DNA_ORIENTATION=+
MTMETDQDERLSTENNSNMDGAMELSSASTTIDPRVVESRIRQSASMQRDATMEGNDGVDQPVFPKLSAAQASGNKIEYRRIRCPPHRYTPLRDHWEQILTPLVEYLKLQVRFNTKSRSVEMKTSAHTIDVGALQKGADFVSAFMMGFEVQDAVALLRLDDLYVESFKVTDVKLLKGDHLSRAVGRIAGQDGKTRFAIENATRTRIVVADTRIYMLGSYANLRVARNAICDLILGAP